MRSRSSACRFRRYFDAEAGLAYGCEFVAAYRRHDGARAREDHGRVHQLGAREERSPAQRIRRSDHAVDGRSRRRRFGGEPLHGQERQDSITPDPTQNCSGRHHAKDGLACSQETELHLARRSSASMDRSELYAADELFLTGTAAGLTFIRVGGSPRRSAKARWGPSRASSPASSTASTSGKNPKVIAIC